MKEKRKNYRIKTALIGFCAVAIMFGLTATGGILAAEVSQEDHEKLQDLKKKEAEKNLHPHERTPPHDPTGGAKHGNLGQAATNPIANLIQLQLINAYNWENHNSSGGANSFIIQPVIPLKMPWEKVPLLITRTTLPYVWTPDLGDPIGRKDGFGDLSFLGLFTPKLKTKGMQLGLGGNFIFPTAGDNDFTGSGKWSAGPALLYINMKTPHLQWGLFAFQDWSYAGDSDREDVNQLALQPFITYHFGKGWYVSSPDVPQTYNFENDKWTWAIGPLLGKVTKIGKQPVKMFGAVYYNPEDDAGPTPEWTARFGLTLLFPK
jgi:hypothetical protein